MITLLLVGCSDSTPTVEPAPNPSPSEEIDQPAQQQQNPTAPLSTLPPTFTPAADVQAAPVGTAEVAELPAVVTPSPTADLNQPVLVLTYQIPAIALNRKLEANLAGKISLIDLTTGNQVDIPNGQRFLTEIVAALETHKSDFQPVDDDCAECVRLGFELPLAGEAAEGILDNPQLLVSVQHLFASRLGAHFPPKTVIGHHRSASGYTVAHTAAQTADGTVYRWLALDPQISVSTDQLAQSRYQTLASRYQGVDLNAACPNFPSEYLNFDGSVIGLRCPELSLGTELVEAYTAGTGLTAPLLANELNLQIPATRLPFGVILFYEQADQSTVTIFDDGAVQATFPITATQTVSGSEESEIIHLPPETVESSIPLSEIEPLVVPLLASDVIPRGVTSSLSLDQAEFEELILIRGTDGVYEFAWSDGVGQELLPGIQLLSLLIEQLRPVSSE